MNQWAWLENPSVWIVLRKHCHLVGAEERGLHHGSQRGKFTEDGMVLWRSHRDTVCSIGIGREHLRAASGGQVAMD